MYDQFLVENLVLTGVYKNFFDELTSKGISYEIANAICTFAQAYDKGEIVDLFVNIDVHHKDAFTINYDGMEVSFLRKKMFDTYIEELKQEGETTDEFGRDLEELKDIINSYIFKEFEVDDIVTYTLPGTDFYVQEL